MDLNHASVIDNVSAAVIHPHEENDDESVKLIETASAICTLVMILMCLCGVVGNSLSLYIYRTPTFRGRSINLLLAALSACDLFLCLLAMPVFSITQIQNFLPDLSKHLTGHILLFAYPVTLMLQSMSVWLLVSITIDRYLAVCHPFKVRAYCTQTRAAITILVIVFFSIAYNFVRFWEFTLNDSGGSATFEDSIVPLLRGDHLFMLLYQNIATLITQFFIPLIVLCFFNLQVARTILQAGEHRRELVSSEKREYSTAKMMLYVVIVFIFCYTLSMVLNLAEILDEELFRQPIGYLLNDVNNILVVINSSSSFIFYTKYSTRFRAQLRNLCCIRTCASYLPCCFKTSHQRSTTQKHFSIDGTTLRSNLPSQKCSTFYGEKRSSRIDLFTRLIEK